MIQLPAGGIGGLKKKGSRKKRTHASVLKAVHRYVCARVDELESLDAGGEENQALLSLNTKATSVLQRHRKELEGLLGEFSTENISGPLANAKANAALHSLEDKDKTTTMAEQSEVGGSTSANTTSQKPVYTMNRAKLHPLKDINSIEWERCVGVERSDEGTDGVLFVELPNSMCVCVKSPGSIAAEMYGAWMAKRLGVPTPGVRLVDRNSEEGQRIIANLTSDRLCSRQQGLRSKIERVVLKPHLLVMQYIKGYPLDYVVQGTGFCETFVKNKFAAFEENDKEQSDETSKLHAVGKLNCRTLGRILGFDVLINNFDRLPCIWNNRGNAGNIIFQGDAGIENMDCVDFAAPHTALGIDNMVSCIDVGKFPDQHAAYLGRASTLLKGLLSEVFQDGSGSNVATTGTTGPALPGTPGSGTTGLPRVREFLQKGTQDGGWPGTGFDIGDSGAEEIQQGFLRCMAAFASIPKHELEAVKETLHETFKEAMTEHCTWGLERIHPAFILRIGSALHQVADESKFMDDVPTEDKSGSLPELEVYSAEPDLSLLPDPKDIAHRRQQNRKMQKENLANLNGITSCSELQVLNPFVLCADDVEGGQTSHEVAGENREKASTGREAPRTPQRSPRSQHQLNTTVASPALLRRLAERQADDQTSGVCSIS